MTQTLAFQFSQELHMIFTFLILGTTPDFTSSLNCGSLKKKKNK